MVFRLFRGQHEGLRILMYHKLDEKRADFLTVRAKDFEEQIKWLLNEGYQFLSFYELEQKQKLGQPLPTKSVILTFDDGYQNNYDLLLPILEKYGLKAIIFLPIGFVGKTNEWDQGIDTIMDWSALERAKHHFEYGVHSFSHRNMAEMSVDEFRKDLAMCLEVVKKNNLNALPVLAYPYGRFVKEKIKRQAYESVLKELGFSFALRIGNTINQFPFKDRYLLCRLDIRGTDSIHDFQSKVQRGKFKIF